MDINPVNKLGFFERLSSMLLRKPEDREQLMELLHSAYERNLLDADALSITEGALAASEISVSDVMVPRSQMEVIDIDDPQSEIIAQVNRTAHSRFPVIDGDRDKMCIRDRLSAKTWAGRMRRMELLRVKIEGDGLG